MAIRHFIQKELGLIRNGQIKAALSGGAWETYWWLLEKTAYESNRETPIWDFPEWDICIVLDATRVDLFEDASAEYGWLPDSIDTIWSVGSMSPEWIGETFAPRHVRDWENVGYVTANPFSSKPNDRAAGAPPGSLPLSPTKLAYLDEVWRDQWQDEPLSTVEPSTMAKRALWAWENHDMERLVVHMMQPHIPFRSRPEWFSKRENLSIFGEPDREGGGFEGEGKDVWKELRDGEHTRDEVWSAYLDNLHWGLEWVDWVRRRTDATIAITSDHGNGMGEYGIWSHPPNNSAPILRRVPFVLIDGSAEHEFDGKVVGNPPVTDDITGSIDEQLEALGYK